MGACPIVRRKWQLYILSLVSPRANSLSGKRRVASKNPYQIEAQQIAPAKADIARNLRRFIQSRCSSGPKSLASSYRSPPFSTAWRANPFAGFTSINRAGIVWIRMMSAASAEAHEPTGKSAPQTVESMPAPLFFKPGASGPIADDNARSLPRTGSWGWLGACRLPRRRPRTPLSWGIEAWCIRDGNVLRGKSAGKLACDPYAALLLSVVAVARLREG